jgi:hypothetical protein
MIVSMIVVIPVQAKGIKTVRSGMCYIAAALLSTPLLLLSLEVDGLRFCKPGRPTQHHDNG